MKLTFCGACGSTYELQHHHLATRGKAFNLKSIASSWRPDAKGAPSVASLATVLREHDWR